MVPFSNNCAPLVRTFLQVRREAEERQRREELDREEKRKAAQQRRDAIVERIRLQQEAEQRCMREAAAVLQRQEQVQP